MALGYSTSVSENLLSRPAFPRSSTLDSDLGSPFWDASTLQADSPQVFLAKTRPRTFFYSFSLGEKLEFGLADGK